MRAHSPCRPVALRVLGAIPSEGQRAEDRRGSAAPPAPERSGPDCDSESRMTAVRVRPPCGRYLILAPENGVAEIRGRWRPCAGTDSSPAAARARSDGHFRNADLLMQRGYLREAVFEAQRAQRLCEPRPAQQALYAWLLHQRSGGGRHVERRVWYLLDRALCADPSCALAHRYRAQLVRLQSEP